MVYISGIEFKDKEKRQSFLNTIKSFLNNNGEEINLSYQFKDIASLYKSSDLLSVIADEEFDKVNFEEMTEDEKEDISDEIMDRVNTLTIQGAIQYIVDLYSIEEVEFLIIKSSDFVVSQEFIKIINSNL